MYLNSCKGCSHFKIISSFVCYQILCHSSNSYLLTFQRPQVQKKQRQTQIYISSSDSFICINEILLLLNISIENNHIIRTVDYMTWFSLMNIRQPGFSMLLRNFKLHQSTNLIELGFVHLICGVKKQGILFISFQLIYFVGYIVRGVHEMVYQFDLDMQHIEIFPFYF